MDNQFHEIKQFFGFLFKEIYMLKNILKHAVVLSFALGSSAVLANTYNFTQITSNGNQSVATQLTAEVTQSGSNVLFTFYNSAAIASSITDIYFDYGNTSFFSSVSNNVLGAAGDSTGVSFSDGASPSNLPSGNNVGFSADASGESNAPGVTASGVNASTEYVSFLGTSLTGVTFADVLAGLDSGAFTLGLHVQGIAGLNGSEAFVTGTPSAVPLPAAGWLFGSALVGLMGLSRRKL